MRTEKDSLGLVKVPENALYGAQTQRALENYQISGKIAHSELIIAFLNLKKAAAITNANHERLSKQNSSLIIRAIETLENILKNEPKKCVEFFPIDPYQAGAGTSQNMNFNEVIANLANQFVDKPLGTYSPIHPNDHVNCSQSTNDVFPTAMRMAILESSSQLKLEIDSISKAFFKKSNEWKNILKSGRTHLQDAVPIHLGEEFNAYSITLAKCGSWIELGRDQLRVLGIGGSAVGTGLNVPQGYAKQMVEELTQLTGEKLRLAPNLIEAMQSQSPILFYSSMLRLVAVEMTRICNDLRLLASGPMTGLAEIILPAVQPGSSIMPGKVNPSIVEMANQTWFSVLGMDQTLVYCTQAGQLELKVMMPMMAYTAIEATRVTTHATRTLRTFCIEGLQANEPRLKKYFETTPQIATALTPRLGYEKTAELVKEALATGESIVELVRKKQLLSTEELESLLRF